MPSSGASGCEKWADGAAGADEVSERRWGGAWLWGEGWRYCAIEYGLRARGEWAGVMVMLRRRGGDVEGEEEKGARLSEEKQGCARLRAEVQESLKVKASHGRCACLRFEERGMSYYFP